MIGKKGNINKNKKNEQFHFYFDFPNIIIIFTVRKLSNFVIFPLILVHSFTKRCSFPDKSLLRYYGKINSLFLFLLQ